MAKRVEKKLRFKLKKKPRFYFAMFLYLNITKNYNSKNTKDILITRFSLSESIIFISIKYVLLKNDVNKKKGYLPLEDAFIEQQQMTKSEIFNNSSKLTIKSK